MHAVPAKYGLVKGVCKKCIDPAGVCQRCDGNEKKCEDCSGDEGYRYGINSAGGCSPCPKNCNACTYSNACDTVSSLAELPKIAYNYQ